MLPEPAPDNDYHAPHLPLLLDSFHTLTGRHLLPPDPDPVETARLLYHAPFFLASHDTAPDPLFTYGNLTAQRLFEMTWDQFTQTPSRFTAEAPNRAERASLLQRVTTHGFIDDYSGIRISSTGQRFRITQATVWNLRDPHGQLLGQAASFQNWQRV
ncbi:MAG: MEKHLA domain-containing protein [Verrucomicrobia bacterium]|nr:MEKHLA domain-containing protein [Verrucomicrobiota bacterium]